MLQTSRLDSITNRSVRLSAAQGGGSWWKTIDSRFGPSFATVCASYRNLQMCSPNFDEELTEMTSFKKMFCLFTFVVLVVESWNECRDILSALFFVEHRDVRMHFLASIIAILPVERCELILLFHFDFWKRKLLVLFNRQTSRSVWQLIISKGSSAPRIVPLLPLKHDYRRGVVDWTKHQRSEAVDNLCWMYSSLRKLTFSFRFRFIFS